MNDITVCITSCLRPTFLNRCLASVVAAGFRNIVIANAGYDPQVLGVVNQWKEQQDISLSFHTTADQGLHFLWELAAYHSSTERIILVHDDDELCPQLGQRYQEQIKPSLDSGVGFASWLGAVKQMNGELTTINHMQRATGVYPSAVMESFVGQLGRLSLSPIVSVFKRAPLIHALKEGRFLFQHQECLHRPGMLLGTEVYAYLRHCSAYKEFLFINEVLSWYGSHPGSGTIQAQQTKNLKQLTAGYDVARRHFIAHRNDPVTFQPKIIFIYNDFTPCDASEQKRFEQAKFTWQFHFDHGDVLEFQVNDPKRSSADIGDRSAVPYIKDLIDFGMRYALPEDIVVYCNRDICLTTLAPSRIIEAIKGHGAAVAPRRSLVPDQGRLYKTVSNCKVDGGFDLFAVTPAWWREHSGKMPDMFIGREGWDTVLRALAEESGRPLNAQVYVDDCIYHQPHQPRWHADRYSNPAQLHNRAAALAFFAARGNKHLIAQMSPPKTQSARPAWATLSNK